LEAEKEMVKFNCQMIMYETRHTDTKDNVKCLRAVAHIPGANIKEFLEIILSLTETGANPPFELVWRVLGTKDPDQKLFSVSGMGFGQQPFEQRRAIFSRLQRKNQLWTKGNSGNRPQSIGAKGRWCSPGKIENGRVTVSRVKGFFLPVRLTFWPHRL
jgi:hypothetical protein